MNNKTDEIIRRKFREDNYIPDSTKDMINDTLKQNRNIVINIKTNKLNAIRKLVTAMASIAIVFIGGITTYGAFGGKIAGIPALDWLGIKFSNKYIEYKQPVENQVIAFENTSVELTSTVCNEGITILEFNLKLSEEDYKKLKLDGNILTDEYLKMQEENKSKIRENVIRELKTEKYNEQWAMGSNRTKYDDIVVNEEEINIRYEEEIEQIEADIEERKNTNYLPALTLNCEQKGGTYNYDKFNPNMVWYATIYIDDTPYYVRNWQSIEKISNCEYTIYTMYMLDDEVLKGKDNFKITLKNNKMVNIINWKSWKGWRNDCQRVPSDATTTIDIPGDFEVKVSKDNILKDSIVITNPNIKSEFRNITHTVEKVVVSPIQTIVTIKHSATKQSSNAFANKYKDPNIEHLPLTREYKVYDANGDELTCFSTRNKNTLIYSNGTREDYDYHDIPNKKYSNATWENIECLLIENTDTEYIKIVPVEVVRNPVEGVEDTFGEIEYEMDPLIINLK